MSLWITFMMGWRAVHSVLFISIFHKVVLSFGLVYSNISFGLVRHQFDNSLVHVVVACVVCAPLPFGNWIENLFP